MEMGNLIISIRATLIPTILVGDIALFVFQEVGMVERIFSVKNPDGRYIHRCQFPDDEFGSRSKFGRNEWVVIDQKNYSHDIYKGMGYFGNVKDPGTFRVVYYEYFIFGPLKGKLHIKVEQCNSN